MIESLAGLPLDVAFISFDDLLAKGVPKDVKVIINCGHDGSAWSGGHYWNDPKINELLTRWVHAGGGFIGIREPSAAAEPGQLFKLSHVLGLDRDRGERLANGKYKFTPPQGSHFVTADIEGDLDELVDDDLIAEDELTLADDDDDAAVVVVVEEDEEEVAVVPEVGAKVATKAGEESDEEDEEEPDDEDVEASLDTILKERLVVEEVEDDEDTPAPEDRTGDGVERVLPKQPGEFVCRSCFLVKHPNQLADRKKMLCRDCV